MATKLKERKLRQHRNKTRMRNEGLDQLKKRVKGNYGADIHFAEHEQKMSEIITDFVEPELDSAPNNTAFENTITAAVLSWNMALLPEEAQEKMLEDALDILRKQIPDISIEDVRSFLIMLIDRKKRYFSHINRFIIDYKLTGWGDNAHLYVASSLTP